MQRLKLLIVSLLSLSLLMACTNNEDEVLENLDTSKIIFTNFSDNKAENNFKTYSVTITNENKIPIEYLNLYLSYPITTENGVKGNDFYAIGIPSKSNTELKENESITFTFSVNLESINIEKVDINNPSLNLRGFANKNVPFEIGGGIGALLVE